VIPNDDYQKLKKTTIEYKINNYTLTQSTTEDVISKLFLKYLNYFELISILIEEYNRKIPSSEEKIGDLFPLTLYFSPYRNPAIQNLRISIAGQDRFNLLENYKKIHQKILHRY